MGGIAYCGGCGHTGYKALIFVEPQVRGCASCSMTGHDLGWTYG